MDLKCEVESKPPPEKLVRAERFLLAPKFFPTPFLNIPYQKMGSIEEWCRSFWGNSPENTIEIGNFLYFSVLHKVFTAFAYRVRAPPSEI